MESSKSRSQLRENKENRPPRDKATAIKKRTVQPVRSRRRVPGPAPRKQLTLRYQQLQAKDNMQKNSTVATDDEGSDDSANHSEVEIPPSLPNSPTSVSLPTYAVNFTDIPVCPKCAVSKTQHVSIGIQACPTNDMLEGQMTQIAERMDES